MTLCILALFLAAALADADPAATCEAEIIVREPLLFIAVLTSSDRATHRALLRHTWFNVEHSFTDTNIVQGRFFVGGLEQKSSSHHEPKDLVTLPTVRDGYSSLPEKSVAAMDWATKHVQPKFFLRVTDDMICDIPALVEFLSSLKADATNVYRGKTMIDVEPERNPQHRNYVSKATFADNYYPTYIHGAAYLLSADLLSKFTVQKLSLQEPDDVRLAMVLLSPEYGSVEAQLDPRFWMMDRVGGDAGDKCRDDAYVAGELELEEIVPVWEAQQRAKKHTAAEGLCAVTKRLVEARILYTNGKRAVGKEDFTR
jgi:hypothetical protein